MKSRSQNGKINIKCQFDSLLPGQEVQCSNGVLRPSSQDSFIYISPWIVGKTRVPDCFISKWYDLGLFYQ